MATPSRNRAAWLLLAAAGLSLMLAWTLASPVGASPDEPAHVWYAWGTVTGQTLAGEHLDSKIFPGQSATTIKVPQKLLQYPDPHCYILRPVPVTTCSTVPADNGQETTQSTYMSRYPPLFYGVEGVALKLGSALGLSGPGVLYGGRLVAGILSLLSIVFGVVLLARRFPARIVLLVTLLGLPASAWFLAASVNPSGLEIAAGFLLAAAVLSFRDDLGAGVRSRTAILAVPVGTLLLAWTRPISWAWAGLILGLLLVPTGRRDGQPWTRRLPLRKLGKATTTSTLAVLVGSVLWFGYALQIRAAEHGLGTPAAWSVLHPLERLTLLLLGSGTIVSDQIGNFGWQDTPLPIVAVLAWMTVAGVAAAAWMAGRNTLMPRWAVVALMGFGYFAALIDEYKGAWVWQGRYLLPITAAACVFAVPGLKKGLERWPASRRLVPWMLIVLMAVNALSVVWFLFRNLYGFTTILNRRIPSAPLPVGTPTWTPTLGQGTVLSLVVLALTCGIFAVWKLQPGNPEHERDLLPKAANVDRLSYQPAQES